MDVLEQDKVEVLLTRYREHAGHLRHLDNFDLKIFGGFISIQLALASWFAIHPIDELRIKLGLFIVNLSLLAVAFFIIRGSRNRRNEVVDVIWNISEALGLDRPGVYLARKSINPPSRRTRFLWYEIGCVLGFFGAMFVLFVSLTHTPCELIPS